MSFFLFLVLVKLMPMNPQHLFYGIVFVKSLDMNGLIKYLSNKIDLSFAAKQYVMSISTHQKIKKGDFIIIKDEEILNIKSNSYIKLFEITSPKKPSYPTYFQRFG